jgi:uncharacterized protein (DUF924 family)
LNEPLRAPWREDAAPGLISALLDAWFGEPDARGDFAFRPVWFRADPAFDGAISRFAAASAAAVAGWVPHLSGSARGALALTLLLDQVPRNLFRDDPRAVAGDPQARRVADAAIAAGFDQQLPALQRLFLYLPFEHSEHLADQERACALIGALGLPGATDYAWRHRQIIARFGRFPHRNRALGRTSTEAELAFLREFPGF